MLINTHCSWTLFKNTVHECVHERGSGSRILYPGCGIQVPNPGSWNPGSRLQDPGSRILQVVPQSRIQDLLLDAGSWIQDPGSRILGLGSTIQDIHPCLWTCLLCSCLDAARCEHCLWTPCSWTFLNVPGPWIQDTGSRILGPGSWIQDAGPWIQDQGSRMLDPGSWTVGSGSRALDPASRILDPGSRIQDTGSWIRNLGSWMQDLGSYGSALRALDPGP